MAAPSYWHLSSPRPRQSQRAKPEAGICVLRNGVQGSVCTATFLSRSCPLWVKSRHGAIKLRCPLYPRKQTLNDDIEVCFVRSSFRQSTFEHIIVRGPIQFRRDFGYVFRCDTDFRKVTKINPRMRSSHEDKGSQTSGIPS